MVTVHNLGFPRIGSHRELKFALESYWKGQSSLEDLLETGRELREKHWKAQVGLDLAPVGDFSFYDQMLDMSFTLGNLPKRVKNFAGEKLDNYFRVARGRSADGSEEVAAGEMTKWFDTNYHYIVPEFTGETEFSLDSTRIIGQIREAKKIGTQVKPVVIGPMTYLCQGKSKDGTSRLALLPRLLPVYRRLVEDIKSEGVEWLQIDEPILATDLDSEWKRAFRSAYNEIGSGTMKLLLTTYFGKLEDNLSLACQLPVDGIHLDAINAKTEVEIVLDQLPAGRVLSLGVVNGRNIWKSDLNKLFEWLQPIAQRLKDRLWIAPSCSLLHVPVDLKNETGINQEIKGWMAFAVQKLEELQILKNALENGKESVLGELAATQMAIDSRRSSPRTNNPAVRKATSKVESRTGERKSEYSLRARLQAESIDLPKFPTTTIGSFPQTAEVRRTRRQFKSGKIDQQAYLDFMESEIESCIREQETLGLDVLVHGESERNDMVEYFGELLEGYAFTGNGWVQSYGSRCVKPPILFGDISRPSPMTVEWTKFAQGLTKKPVKGMLTGPVTMLNWSFVRDDQPRRESCLQLALAIRQEVLDLEAAGIQIIQIDEAALREGLPLRKSEWQHYLDWAIGSFRIAANGVRNETQIHTHMCYSEFNDIIESIAEMDADVITIETSRSDMELLIAFEEFEYPNGIGPGVYDIHSPSIPTENQIVDLMKKATERIPEERLWVNPDCGLKTRKWDEVIPALENLVSAAKRLRARSAANVA